MTDLQVKTGTLRDVQALAFMEKECFTDPWSETSLRSHLASSFSGTWVLWEGENPVGYLLMEILPPEAEIYRVAVLPSLRGKGGATLLFSAFLREHPEAETCFLEVREHNLPALGFYRKMGFLPVGQRKNYYKNPVENALIYKWERSKNIACTGI